MVTTLAVMAIAVVGLAGCSMPAMNAGGDSGLSYTTAEMGAVERDLGAVGAVGSAPDVGDKQFVTTGRMTISVEHPTDAADDATRIVEGAGGHISARTDRRPSEGFAGRADLTLRIPAGALSRVLAELEDLGETVQLAHEDVEVTMQVRDLDARISALEAAIDRLLALMVQADSTEDLIAVESALTQRQIELEQLSSQRRYLADQVSLSTIHLALIAPDDTPVVEPQSFWSGLVLGWNAFVGFWASVLVAIGVMAPWLVLLALLAAGIAWAVRSSVKRARSSQPVPASDAPAAD